MQTLNFEAFKQLDKNQLNGAYVFTSDTCGMCEMFERELKTVYGHKTQNWTIIETLTEDNKDYIGSLADEYKICPFTAVFKGGQPIFQRNGALFATQMQQAIEMAENA